MAAVAAVPASTLDEQLNQLKSSTEDDKNSVERILLTLDNVLLPSEKLDPTPSRLDGLDFADEQDLRYCTCELIQAAGILLKLPQVAMATAQVIFQRYYYAKSLVRHPSEHVAMACLVLASKIEEHPRRIRDVCNVFHHLKQWRQKKAFTPLLLDQNYVDWKTEVIKAERRVLKELGFCVHVKHPHKIIVMYLQILGMEREPRLVQCAWNYMNDSFRSDVFVRFSPEAIACGCIYLAAWHLQVPLPNQPPWYALFDQDVNTLRSIAICILDLYKRSKPDLDALEAKVSELRNLIKEEKLKQQILARASGKLPENPTLSFLRGDTKTSDAGSLHTSPVSATQSERQFAPDRPSDTTSRSADRDASAHKVQDGLSESAARKQPSNGDFARVGGVAETTTDDTRTATNRSADEIKREKAERNGEKADDTKRSKKHEVDSDNRNGVKPDYDAKRREKEKHGHGSHKKERRHRSSKKRRHHSKHRKGSASSGSLSESPIDSSLSDTDDSSLFEDSMSNSSEDSQHARRKRRHERDRAGSKSKKSKREAVVDSNAVRLKSSINYEQRDRVAPQSRDNERDRGRRDVDVDWDRDRPRRDDYDRPRIMPYGDAPTHRERERENGRDRERDRDREREREREHDYTARRDRGREHELSSRR